MMPFVIRLQFLARKEKTTLLPIILIQKDNWNHAIEL